MKIAVIGTGYVGITTAASLGELGHEIIGVDIDEKKIARLKQGILPIYEPGVDLVIEQMSKQGSIHFTTSIKEAVEQAEILFIAVGTPSLPDGKANLQYVEAVAHEIGKYMQSYLVVVDKSTVPVGTAERVRLIIEKELKQRNITIMFDVVSNPEFLKEGKALEDARKPDRIVIGCSSEKAQKKMLELYQDINAPLFITTPRNAEMIKYASNAFLATKISFINELSRLCHEMSIDITEVSKGMGLDKRIGPQFLQAGLGYGGSCFPKDVAALCSMGNEQSILLSILKSVQEVNKTQVEWFVRQIEMKIGYLGGKSIALLGLSFKPDTDDIREAPSLKLIPMLVQRGVSITAYDPIVRDPDGKLFPGAKVTEDVESTVQGVDAIVLCTEWEEFRKLDWRKIRESVKGNFVFDARNALNPQEISSFGFCYVGVSRIGG